MECRRNACTSAAITADTRSVMTFKLNAEITQLNRYTHGRVPDDVSLGDAQPQGAVRTRSSKGNCARNTPPP
ncbi:hypothetical protein C6341_g14152 [Phytophthora cactorum]|nr:hypothetical protein C6341_g14152 [Phytophthora cactorum]